MRLALGPAASAAASTRRILLCSSGKRSARRHVLGHGARRDPESRVLLEEIRGADHDAHGLGRHDGEVLGAGEMRQAKLVVEHNVRVLNVLVALDPVRHGLVERVAHLARRLADVVARRVLLVVSVGRDKERLGGKVGALGDNSIGLGQQGRARVVDDLVANGLLGDAVDHIGVDNVPVAARLVAVRCGALLGRAQRRLLAVKGIAKGVGGRACGRRRDDGVVLHNRVVGAVNLGVDAQAKDVLVVVGGDALGDLGAVGGGDVVGAHAVRVELAGELDLEVICAVEGEGVVKGVLVVGGRDDLRDDELAVAGGDDGAVTVVGVLVEDAVVLLVDADGVLENGGLARVGRHDGIHVVDGALAVASQLERVGHETGAVLAHVKGVLLVVRGIRVAVGHNHLDNRDAVEERTLAVLVGVVDGHVGNDNALAVVEANVHLVAGPGKLVAADLERHALGLRNVNGLEHIRLVAVGNEIRQKVVRDEGGGGALAVDVGNVDGNDLGRVGVGNNGNIQRVGVLVVQLRVAVVHKTLLQSALKTPTLIDTNGPAVNVHLGHVGDADLCAGRNHAGVLAGGNLDNVEIFESEGGSDIRDVLPVLNLARLEIYNDLAGVVGALFQDNSKGLAGGSGSRAALKGSVLGLGGIMERNAVEFCLLCMRLLDDLAGGGNLNNIELIQRVRNRAGGLGTLLGESFNVRIDFVTSNGCGIRLYRRGSHDVCMCVCVLSQE